MKACEKGSIYGDQVCDIFRMSRKHDVHPLYALSNLLICLPMSDSVQHEASESKMPPRALVMVTLPLIFGLVYNCVSLVMLPFPDSEQRLRETYAAIAKIYQEQGNQVLPSLTTDMVQLSLWVTFIVLAATILWFDYTRRAIKDRRSAGRTSAIVLGFVSLLVIPLGTLLGTVMLIGVFNKDVKAYLNQK